ncbi:MAG: hypothetical protein D6769_00240 [Methanobacteriota archaeon]|nr:MAG: hypothetical protein D6769_00240 [Euryarchaeota archaeon]
MKRLFLVFSLAFLLLAGCTTIPSLQQPSNGVANTSIANNIDKAKVSEITSLFNDLSALQGGSPTLKEKSVENVQLIKIVYDVNGNSVEVYVTPDYNNIIIPNGGKALSKTDLKNFVEQAKKAKATQGTQQTVPDNVAPASTAPYEGNGSVTVIEFSDFQCPFCGSFYANTYGSLKKDYVDSGKATFYYMNFPLKSIHPYAEKAAEAASCAQEQGNDFFWAMHNLLFENQANLSVDNIKKLASGIDGLDTTAFESCLDSGNKSSLVSSDLNTGLSFGVTGTPTFYIYKEGLPSDKESAVEAAAQSVGATTFKDKSGKLVVVLVGAQPKSAFDTVLAAFNN